MVILNSPTSAKRIAKFGTVREQGVALLELAIIAPVLIVLSGVWDVSQLILTHMSMTQVAREEVRTAAGIQALEWGIYAVQPPSPPDGTFSCSTGTPPSDCMLGARHANLVQSIHKRLLSAASSDPKRLDVVPATIAVVSDYNYSFDFVKVTISATYDGLFIPFDGLKISVTAAGPYL